MERSRNKKERERGLGVAPGDHGLCPVLAAVGHSVWRPWPWGVRSIPWEHSLGNRRGNWRVRRRARDSISANEPCWICRNCDENSVDNSKLNCKCIPFTIGVKINEGTKGSERDTSRSYYFRLYWNIHTLAGCPWTWQEWKPGHKTRVPIYLIFVFNVTRTVSLQKDQLIRGRNSTGLESTWSLLAKGQAMVTLWKGDRTNTWCF